MPVIYINLCWKWDVLVYNHIPSNFNAVKMTVKGRYFTNVSTLWILSGCSTVNSTSQSIHTVHTQAYIGLMDRTCLVHFPEVELIIAVFSE